MLKENLSMLRMVKGASQEEAAEVAGVSRQAYAKWESGASVPDVERCARLADYYGVTIDSLVNFDRDKGGAQQMPAPKGKHIWGPVTVDGKGRIELPEAARELFGIEIGDRLLVLGDEEQGIALVDAEVFEDRMNESLKAAGLLG